LPPPFIGHHLYRELIKDVAMVTEIHPVVEMKRGEL
jgi:hypothetical protein